MPIDFPLAEKFLQALGDSSFIFQTFTDSKQLKSTYKKLDPLARVFVGSFDEHKSKLAALNDQGAGVFVQINAGSKRGKDHVTKVRALFLDLDDPRTSLKSMELARTYLPMPSIITTTSTSKYHLIWCVTDCPVNAFKQLQSNLSVTFGGDPQIKNVDRVLRIPGFYHKKLKPVKVSARVYGGSIGTAEFITQAAKAPVMALSKQVAAAVASNDVFGLDIAESHTIPTELAPGDRTHKLVAHAGYLISQGFSEDYVEAEIRQMNVSLCAAGAEPIPDNILEQEVLGCVSKFANERASQIQATTQIPPPAPPPPAPVPPAPGVAPPAPLSVPDTNEELHSLDAWIKRFLFIEHGSFVIDRIRKGRHAILSFTDFQRKYANVLVGSSAKLHSKWVHSPLRQDVRTTTFIPTNQKIVVEEHAKKWNVYTPTDLAHITVEVDLDKIKPFQDHIKMLFPMNRDRKLFMDWMAMTVQKPHIRIPWAPLLISEPGAGKGFIYRVLSELCGVHNCKMINADRLENQFNSFMANSVVVCIDEMKFSRKSGVAAKLRSYITERSIEVNRKGVEEYDCAVYANFIVFTNNMGATYVDPNDRRFWVHRIPQVPDSDHFEAVWSWIDNRENLAHMLQWLLNYDLRGFAFASQPPMTIAKHEMIEASKSEIEKEFEMCVDAHQGPFKGDIISYQMALDYMALRLNSAIVGRNESAFKTAWELHTSSLIGDRSRARSMIGIKAQHRVRCLRNASYWSESTPEARNYEITRVIQMIHTPNDVWDPKLLVVE